METCVLCSKTISDGQKTVILTEKGSSSVNNASKERGDTISVVPGQIVHKDCRKKYIHSYYIHSSKRKSYDDSHLTTRDMRSNVTFTSDNNCMFCGKSTRTSQFHQGSVFKVRTLGLQDTIAETCQKRNDYWSDSVTARIEYARDMHAADAVYHQECSVNFRTGKQIPSRFANTDTTPAKRYKKSGRPIDIKKEEAFTHVTEYLKNNDEEQITMNELICKMGEYLQDTECEAYGFTHMKKRLIDTFGDKIIFAEINGKQNVVTFKTTAANILHTFYSQAKHDDPEEEKKRIIETAAKLLKNDIKSARILQPVYPSCSDISSISAGKSFLPLTLCLLLQILFVGKCVDTKVASIGHAIVQAVRPRAIVAPLQIGLGVQMHRHFGSRFLIDSLNRHGFCSSYTEVQKYERSAALNQNNEIPGFIPGQFVQYAADNVDHNIRILDGLNTFHGMGIIASLTPESRSTKAVPKVSVTLDDVSAVSRINIQFYKPHHDGMASLRYEKLVIPPVEDSTYNIDLLWKTAWLLKPCMPSWNGFMQMVQQGAHPGKSSVIFMPMIDMKSSDETCIYSTMHFISEQSKRYDVTPILTFDQPLWWKATEIQQSEPPSSAIQNMILRLGGLHIEMSFLGSIGHLMGGSGLQDILKTIYADTAVGHMLSGKAISRAIRGHLIVEKAIYGIMLSRLYDLPLQVTNISETEDTCNAETVPALGNSVSEYVIGQSQSTCVTDNTILNDSTPTPFVEETVGTTVTHTQNSDTDQVNDMNEATRLLTLLLAGVSAYNYVGLQIISTNERMLHMQIVP